MDRYNAAIDRLNKLLDRLETVIENLVTDNEEETDVVFEADPELDQAINEGNPDVEGKYTMDDLLGDKRPPDEDLLNG